MSTNRQRRDGERRPGDRGDRGDRDRRDYQPDEEQQRRPGDPDLQESDSLTALKAILGKVAGLLTSLQLNQEESISLVEQMYGSVLDMDLKLAGETDDKRKAAIQAHIQNAAVTRAGGKLVVEYPKIEAPKPESEKPAPADKPAPAEKPAASEKPTPAEKAVEVAPKAVPEAAAPEVAPVPAPVQQTLEEAVAAAPEPAQEELPQLDPTGE